jgi:hypothetical protein
MQQFDELKPAEFKLFNIRSVVTPAIPGIPDFLTPVAAVGRFRIYDAPGAGYFDVVDATAVVPVSRDTFFDICENWLHSDAFHRSQYLVMDLYGDAPPLPPPPRSTAPAGTASNERQTGQVYEADIDAARAAFVLFRMTWHPCWHAYVDGRLARTVMLSPGFLGAPVAAGHHHILLSYEPGNIKILMAIASFLIVGLAIGGESWYGKRVNSRRVPGSAPPPGRHSPR